jgi:hypothetical protein
MHEISLFFRQIKKRIKFIWRKKEKGDEGK